MFQKVGFSNGQVPEFEDQRKERYVRLQQRVVAGLGSVGYKLRDADSCSAILHVLAWMMQRGGYSPDDFDALAAHVRDDVWDPLDRPQRPQHLC